MLVYLLEKNKLPVGKKKNPQAEVNFLIQLFNLKFKHLDLFTSFF